MSDAPTLLGIGRDKDNKKAMVLYMDREATDDVMRDVHRVLTTNKEVVCHQVRTNRKAQPNDADDWSTWRHIENVETWRNRAARMPGSVQIRGLIVNG